VEYLTVNMSGSSDIPLGRSVYVPPSTYGDVGRRGSILDPDKLPDGYRAGEDSILFRRSSTHRPPFLIQVEPGDVASTVGEYVESPLEFVRRRVRERSGRTSPRTDVVARRRPLPGRRTTIDDLILDRARGRGSTSRDRAQRIFDEAQRAADKIFTYDVVDPRYWFILLNGKSYRRYTQFDADEVFRSQRQKFAVASNIMIWAIELLKLVDIPDKFFGVSVSDLSQELVNVFRIILENLGVSSLGRDGRITTSASRDNVVSGIKGFVGLFIDEQFRLFFKRMFAEFSETAKRISVELRESSGSTVVQDVFRILSSVAGQISRQLLLRMDPASQSVGTMFSKDERTLEGLTRRRPTKIWEAFSSRSTKGDTIDIFGHMYISATEKLDLVGIYMSFVFELQSLLVQLSLLLRIKVVPSPSRRDLDMIPRGLVRSRANDYFDMFLFHLGDLESLYTVHTILNYSPEEQRRYFPFTRDTTFGNPTREELVDVIRWAKGRIVSQHRKIHPRHKGRYVMSTVVSPEMFEIRRIVKMERAFVFTGTGVTGRVLPKLRYLKRRTDASLAREADGGTPRGTTFGSFPEGTFGSQSGGEAARAVGTLSDGDTVGGGEAARAVGTSPRTIGSLPEETFGSQRVGEDGSPRGAARAVGTPRGDADSLGGRVDGFFREDRGSLGSSIPYDDGDTVPDDDEDAVPDDDSLEVTDRDDLTLNEQLFVGENIIRMFTSFVTRNLEDRRAYENIRGEKYTGRRESVDSWADPCPCGIQMTTSSANFLSTSSVVEIQNRRMNKFYRLATKELETSIDSKWIELPLSGRVLNLEESGVVGWMNQIVAGLNHFFYRVERKLFAFAVSGSEAARGSRLVTKIYSLRPPRLVEEMTRNPLKIGEILDTHKSESAYLRDISIYDEFLDSPRTFFQVIVLFYKRYVAVMDMLDSIYRQAPSDIFPMSRVKIIVYQITNILNMLSEIGLGEDRKIINAQVNGFVRDALDFKAIDAASLLPGRTILDSLHRYFQELVAWFTTGTRLASAKKTEIYSVDFKPLRFDYTGRETITDTIRLSVPGQERVVDVVRDGEIVNRILVDKLCLDVKFREEKLDLIHETISYLMSKTSFGVRIVNSTKSILGLVRVKFAILNEGSPPRGRARSLPPPRRTDAAMLVRLQTVAAAADRVSRTFEMDVGSYITSSPILSRYDPVQAAPSSSVAAPTDEGAPSGGAPTTPFGGAPTTPFGGAPTTPFGGAPSTVSFDEDYSDDEPPVEVKLPSRTVLPISYLTEKFKRRADRIAKRFGVFPFWFSGGYAPFERTERTWNNIVNDSISETVKITALLGRTPAIIAQNGQILLELYAAGIQTALLEGVKLTLGGTDVISDVRYAIKYINVMSKRLEMYIRLLDMESPTGWDDDASLPALDFMNTVANLDSLFAIVRNIEVKTVMDFVKGKLSEKHPDLLPSIVGFGIVLQHGVDTNVFTRSAIRPLITEMISDEADLSYFTTLFRTGFRLVLRDAIVHMDRPEERVMFPKTKEDLVFDERRVPQFKISIPRMGVYQKFFDTVGEDFALNYRFFFTNETTREACIHLYGVNDMVNPILYPLFLTKREMLLSSTSLSLAEIVVRLKEFIQDVNHAEIFLYGDSWINPLVPEIQREDIIDPLTYSRIRAGHLYAMEWNERRTKFLHLLSRRMKGLFRDMSRVGMLGRTVHAFNVFMYFLTVLSQNYETGSIVFEPEDVVKIIEFFGVDKFIQYIIRQRLFTRVDLFWEILKNPKFASFVTLMLNETPLNPQMFIHLDKDSSLFRLKILNGLERYAVDSVYRGYRVMEIKSDLGTLEVDRTTGWPVLAREDDRYFAKREGYTF
jgi:hypothetical protein